jgi:5-enolpyruvylshikimate-3-phosphate synthase
MFVFADGTILSGADKLEQVKQKSQEMEKEIVLPVKVLRYLQKPCASSGAFSSFFISSFLIYYYYFSGYSLHSGARAELQKIRRILIR